MTVRTALGTYEVRGGAPAEYVVLYGDRITLNICR